MTRARTITEGADISARVNTGHYRHGWAPPQCVGGGGDRSVPRSAALQADNDNKVKGSVFQKQTGQGLGRSWEATH